MKLVVALGNPGPEYLLTRHNVGFMFLDHLAEHLNASPFSHHKKANAELIETQFKTEKLLLTKPQTYMNESGRAVKWLADFYKIPTEHICIIHDDLDIRVGSFKVQVGKGPKVHNGVLSIEQHLGRTDFLRVRIGVDGRNPDIGDANRPKDARGYVLQSFLQSELAAIQDEVFPQALLAVMTWLGGGKSEQ